MIELHLNSAVLVFDEFLAYLRQQGFIIGVDHYLRLQELLNKINGECAPSELKTLLAPIFATSQIQQEKFYTAFDTYFGLLRVAPESPPPDPDEYLGEQPAVTPAPNPKPRLMARRLIYPVGGALIAVLAIALAIFITKPRPANNTDSNNNQQANQNQNAGQEENRNDDSRNDNSASRNNRERNSNSSQALNRNESTPPVQEPGGASYTNESRPPAPPLLGPGLRSAIRTGAVSIPILIFFIYEWYRYRRRKLVLQKQRTNKPPHVYTVRIESPASKIFKSGQFYTAARRMRRRQSDKFQRLDVMATVSATIESSGYPTFRYKPDSKVPEYLILIDRASFRDHQAQYFENLATALKQEGLYVTSYFYDGDPRVCCNAKGEYAHLSDIQNRYADNRLLVYGNGEKMIDPLTGELEPWTSSFSYWQTRAILTPEAPGQWGLREKSLAALFTVVPADLDGLLALVDYFESGILTGNKLLTKNGHDVLPRELDGGDAIEQLRRYLGERSFQWLCACAVYPELRWGLTLYLGSLSSMGEHLIKESSLLRLASLPWFRTGSIPDAIRLSLIRELDKEKEKAIREAIIELLEQAPPAKKAQPVSTADGYELNLAVQDRFFHFDDRDGRKLRRVTVNLPPQEDFQDYTLIRFLESAPNTRLALLLPRRLRAFFYSNAMPEFGLRTSVRFTMTLALIAAVWSGLNWVMPPLPKVKINGFSASQTSVAAGDAVILRYGVSDASGARIDPQPGEVEISEENVVEVAPEETTTYKLTATDGDGRKLSRELTVEVVPETALRIVGFTAEPSSIVPGGAARLCYELRNVAAYKIVSDSGQVIEEGNSNEVLPVRISCAQSAPDKTTTYTLTATGGDGASQSQPLTVEVVSANDLRIISFQADSSTLNEGDKTRLCYEVTNATGVEIVSSSGEKVATKDNCGIVAPAQTTVYTLTATGQSGQQQQSLTVRVVPRDKVMIKGFAASATSVAPGESFQLCYEIVNANHAEVRTFNSQVWVNRQMKSPGKYCVRITPKQTATYTLTAYQIGKTDATVTDRVSKALTVEVKAPSDISIDRLTARPDTLAPGESGLLCFLVESSLPLKDVRVTPPVGPLVDTPSRLIKPPECHQIAPKQTTTYTVTATDASGKTVSQQVTVRVAQATKPPAITFFTTSNSSITEGESVDICYGVTNADKAVINYSTDGKMEGRKDVAVSEKNCASFSPTQTTTYELIATNSKGDSDSKRISVTVQSKPGGKQDSSQSPAQASGSSTTGAIIGQVKDTEGKPLPSARVTAEREDLGLSRTIVTNEKGEFVITILPPGYYKITAHMDGYIDETYTHFPVQLSNDVIRRPYFTLRRAPSKKRPQSN